MLYLRPAEVRMDLARTDYRKPAREQVGYAPGAFDRDAEIGVYGDPTLATADKGRRILAIMEKNWLAAIDQFVAANP